jgi:hypothetical protein
VPWLKESHGKFSGTYAWNPKKRFLRKGLSARLLHANVMANNFFFVVVQKQRRGGYARDAALTI